MRVTPVAQVNFNIRPDAHHVCQRRRPRRTYRNRTGSAPARRPLVTPKVCAFASRATPSEDCIGSFEVYATVWASNLRCQRAISMRARAHSSTPVILLARLSQNNRVAKIAVNTVLPTGADADTSPVRNLIAGMRHGDQPLRFCVAPHADECNLDLNRAAYVYSRPKSFHNLPAAWGRLACPRLRGDRSSWL